MSTNELADWQNMLLVLGIAMILGLVAYLGWVSFRDRKKAPRPEEADGVAQMK
ncbi:MAG: hypothetical protein V2A55_01920 [Candidatus Jorgensenbacteria bacterium]